MDTTIEVRNIIMGLVIINTALVFLCFLIENRRQEEKAKRERAYAENSELKNAISRLYRAKTDSDIAYRNLKNCICKKKKQITKAS